MEIERICIMLISFGAGLVMGVIYGWLVTLGLCQTRKRKEYMEKLSDKEYRMVDKIRRL